MSSQFFLSLGYTFGRSAPCLGGLAFSLKAICKLRPQVSCRRLCFVFSGTQLLVHHKVCTEIDVLVKHCIRVGYFKPHSLLSEVHFTAGFSWSVQCLPSPVLDRLDTPFAVFASILFRVTAPAYVLTHSCLATITTSSTSTHSTTEHCIALLTSDLVARPIGQHGEEHPTATSQQAA